MRISWIVTLVSSLLCAVPLVAQSAQVAQPPAKRTLTAADVNRVQDVQNPQVSPDGKWIAYTVSSVDREADKRTTALWMVNWEGTQDLPLTVGPYSSTSPRWSPDGKYLAFLSTRPAEGKAQVWLLDRRGGEPTQLTKAKADVQSFEWSPDGKRLVLVVQESDADADAAPAAKPKPPKPIVIDRLHFKQDTEGYLTASSLQHLYLFDLENKQLAPLTGENGLAESEPAWSPDGSQIAFVGNHAAEHDQTGTSDILIAAAQAGAKPRKLLTVYDPASQPLRWSPDGRQIAFLQGLEPKLNAYLQDVLTTVPVAGGPATPLTTKLDRPVYQLEYSADGSSLTFFMDDDRRMYLAKIAAGGGSVERITDGSAVLSARASGGGRTAVAASTDTAVSEVYALEDGKLRKLTAHNDALFAELQLGAVEDIAFHSKDGTDVHGMMIKPPGYEPGKKYPTLLFIHGGPNGQDAHDLDSGQFVRQFLAANNYVVLAINYRGSRGRGAAFQRSIVADWGNKEVADLLASVDYAVQQGIADPDRLGIGGWSYGGILTDYAIASDPRFKVAISGAGSANQISMYGSDQYALQYNNELGPPWSNQDLWLKLSYPFFHADRIHTPTLFMGGQNDFNVPIIGSEQMYQALRTLGVPTQLVIYPGEFHGFTRPSFITDRLERDLAWFDKYLKSAK